MIRQFAFHDRVSKTPPKNTIFDLYEKARQGEKLTRGEKDRIADALYGTFGQGRATYRYMGWEAPFYNVLPAYLVKQKYYGWQEYYAPDKTSLRKALFGAILKIVELER